MLCEIKREKRQQYVQTLHWISTREREREGCQSRFFAFFIVCLKLLHWCRYCFIFPSRRWRYNDDLLLFEAVVNTKAIWDSLLANGRRERNRYIEFRVGICRFCFELNLVYEFSSEFSVISICTWAFTENIVNANIQTYVDGISRIVSKGNKIWQSLFSHIKSPWYDCNFIILYPVKNFFFTIALSLLLSKFTSI